MFVGLVMAAGTLGVLAWASDALRRRGRADDGHDHVRAVPAVLLARDRGRGRVGVQRVDPRRTARCSSATGLSVLTIILATELRLPPAAPGDRQPDRSTSGLVCIVVALSLIVVEEVRKLLKIRTDEAPARPAVATEAAA